MEIEKYDQNYNFFLLHNYLIDCNSYEKLNSFCFFIFFFLFSFYLNIYIVFVQSESIVMKRISTNSLHNVFRIIFCSLLHSIRVTNVTLHWNISRIQKENRKQKSNVIHLFLLFF